MLDIRDNEIGGARVRRAFDQFQKVGIDEDNKAVFERRRLLAGVYLTAEQVLDIPIANRRALADSNYLEIFPKLSAIPAPNLERFVVGSTEKGHYNVIEGRILNEAPVSLEEAKALMAEASNG